MKKIQKFLYLLKRIMVLRNIMLITSHIYEGTPVHSLFSKVNIAHLQKLMKYHVYLQSGKNIL